MKQPVPLLPEHYYHIYNRGNNRGNIFYEEENYRYFMQLYIKHVHPIASTYAYCLMPNHFHFLLRIHRDVPKAEQSIGNLFNAYAKAINKRHNRTGSVFEKGFHRILVPTDSYFSTLIFYIHFNPQKHGFVTDFREWKWSSYGALTTAGVTKVNRQEVWDIFGGREPLVDFHQGVVNEKLVEQFFGDDF